MPPSAEAESRAWVAGADGVFHALLSDPKKFFPLCGGRAVRVREARLLRCSADEHHAAGRPACADCLAALRALLTGEPPRV